MQWKQLAEDAGRPNMVGRASSRMAEKFTSADGIGTAPKPYVYNGSQWAAAALPEGRRNTQFIEYDGELLCVGGATPSANVAGTVWKLTESGWEDYSSGYSAVTPPRGWPYFMATSIPSADTAILRTPLCNATIRPRAGRR
jgi:hypothetical protein